MKANEKQIGGDHYKRGGEEHWDRQYRLFGAGYFIGCITKYVERYQRKNGIQDLQKAQHFIEKLIELEQENMPTATIYHRSAQVDDGSEPGAGYVNQDR